VMLWGLFILWLATRNDRVHAFNKVVYFIILFYISPSVLNPFYALFFAIIICLLIFVIVRNPKPVLDHVLRLTGNKPVFFIFIYTMSIVDLALIFLSLVKIF
jgi:hypothetical protein